MTTHRSRGPEHLPLRDQEITVAHLNEAAIASLTGYEISREQWIAHHGYNGTRMGDACGCPDDRCAGYHHGADEECGCLPVLLEDQSGAPQC